MLAVAARYYLERRASRAFLLRLPKSYAFATPIILNENNAGSFQSLAKRGFVRECNWNFPINNFCSPDCRYSRMAFSHAEEDHRRLPNMAERLTALGPGRHSSSFFATEPYPRLIAVGNRIPAASNAPRSAAIVGACATRIPGFASRRLTVARETEEASDR